MCPLPRRLILLVSFLVVQTLGLFSETLTIATYNVENYTLAGRMVEGVYQRGYPKPEDKKQALRQVIKALDADVIAFQEMGSRPFLDELQRDLKTDGVDYPYSEVLEAADADRHVAVLSRRRFTTVRKHPDLLFTYFGKIETVKRGMLEVEIATETGPLTLFVVHLKSRLTERADDPESAGRRLAEAEAARDRVLSIFPNPSAQTARFMILGDCNDHRASRPLAVLTKRGKLEITTPLAAADSRGETWTHFFAKQDSYSRVDFILISPPLKSAVERGVAQIHDGPGTRQASDHRPVSVRLNLSPAK